MKNKKGFTLIELLVVIAIIGLLSTLAVVALNNARIKSRDARRVSDVKQMQTAFELYMNDIGTYPVPPAATICFPAAAAGEIGGCCIHSTGILAACPATGTTYMASAPDDPLTTEHYLATQDNSATYVIAYTLEGDTAGIPAGLRHATPVGINN